MISSNSSAASAHHSRRGAFAFGQRELGGGFKCRRRAERRTRRRYSFEDREIGETKVEFTAPSLPTGAPTLLCAVMACRLSEKLSCAESDRAFPPLAQGALRPSRRRVRKSVQNSIARSRLRSTGTRPKPLRVLHRSIGQGLTTVSIEPQSALFAFMGQGAA